MEPRQQHDLPVGKFERVMMGVKYALVDLAKDRNTGAANPRDAGTDAPPLKWSDLRYVSDIQEDGNGKEALQA
jgi:hypothetical protein